MKNFFSKAIMVIMSAIMILSVAPMASNSVIVSDSPVAVVAQAASKKIHLNKTKKSIYIGKKYTLKLIDKKGKTISASKVKWSRSNKTVASVSKKGVVTGKKAGKIKITATYKGKKYTAVITVKSAVSLSKSKVTFKAGETAKKTIKVTCKDDKGIKWKTVEGSGIVNLSQAKKWKNDTKSLYITPTGKKFGTAKIKVYSKENSNSYDYLTVEVKKPTSIDGLAMYQKAVKDINENGVAGYSKKSWQTLDSINITGSSVLQSTFKSLLEGFLTTEEDAEVKVNEKGSEDAMRRMPLSDCSKDAVKSVTVKESGSNLVITIVMKDEKNPATDDTDGLNVMSNDILYIEDIYNTIENDSAVSSVIKKVNRADVTYKGYTIKATMTKDGKLVSIEHYGPADLVTEMNTITGNIGFSGRINFNAKYYDFRY